MNILPALELDILSLLILTDWIPRTTRGWWEHVLRDLRPWFHSKLLARLLRWQPSYKVTVAERVAREANPAIQYEAIVGDVTEPAVAERLVDCDAIFLAADSMQARLVVNAICHQYLDPRMASRSKGGQRHDRSNPRRFLGNPPDLIPGQSCLWCNELI